MGKVFEDAFKNGNNPFDGTDLNGNNPFAK